MWIRMQESHQFSRRVASIVYFGIEEKTRRGRRWSARGHATIYWIYWNPGNSRVVPATRLVDMDRFKMF